MQILRTKLNTYILQMEKDGDDTDIISDCFNSRLYLYHFSDYNYAKFIMDKFLAAHNGDEIKECFDSIPEHYSII